MRREDITCPVPVYTADEFMAAPKLASDTFNENAIVRKRQDRSIDLLDPSREWTSAGLQVRPPSSNGIVQHL